MSEKKNPIIPPCFLAVLIHISQKSIVSHIVFQVKRKFGLRPDIHIMYQNARKTVGVATRKIGFGRSAS